jgi:hypothetical protein
VADGAAGGIPQPMVLWKMSTPYGLCHCGCGGKTRIPRYNDRSNGIVAGVPISFIDGHNRKLRGTVEEAVPFKIQGVYCRLVPLTRGFYAIVNESDYARVMRLKWYASWSEDNQCWYATRRAGKIDGEVGTAVQMHRFILGLGPDDPHVDHVDNKQTLNNSRLNLRIATPSQNQMNRKKNANNTSGFKGVYYDQRRRGYVASITKQGKKKHLGTRSTAAAAGALYAIAAAEQFGEFARLE